MKKIECTCCHKLTLGTKLETYDWGSYCPSCVEEHMYCCSTCGELETKRFSEEYNTNLCENCYSEQKELDKVKETC